MTSQSTNNLKIIRIGKQLTQKQAAKALGMQCENRLSHWEKGTSFPNIPNLSKLCKLYAVKAEDIYPELDGTSNSSD